MDRAKKPPRCYPPDIEMNQKELLQLADTILCMDREDPALLDSIEDYLSGLDANKELLTNSPSADVEKFVEKNRLVLFLLESLKDDTSKALKHLKLRAKGFKAYTSDSIPKRLGFRRVRKG